jgi:hypothetical protein
MESDLGLLRNHYNVLRLTQDGNFNLYINLKLPSCVIQNSNKNLGLGEFLEDRATKFFGYPRAVIRYRYPATLIMALIGVA